MKDIDFDELDKAVSSLLSPGQGDNRQAPPDTKPQDKKETSQADGEKIELTERAPAALKPSKDSDSKNSETEKATPAPVKKDEPALEEPLQKPKSSQPAITPRRAGRFMDVVHPDALQKDKTAPIAVRTARVIQPPSGDVLTETPAAPDTHASLSSPATPANSTEPVWPDPIAVIDEPEVAAPAEDSDPTSENLQPMKDWDMANEPLSEQDVKPAVQFINDAKVEKRPLGAFSDSTSEGAADMDGDGLKDFTSRGFHATRMEVDIDYRDEQEDGQDQATEPSQVATEPAPSESDEQFESEVKLSTDTLPRELEKDIMAVEADSIIIKTDRTHNIEAAKPDTAGSGAPMTADAMVSHASAVSIQKQYNEPASTEDTAAHSLFDTQEYHPPITHYSDSHSHKNTVIWVVVALLLLIATAAGFGYWLYLQI